MPPSAKAKSKTRFLLDENVDVRIAPFLRRKGYEALLCPKGIKNGAVIAMAKKESCVLLTNDSDFANTGMYNPAELFGIIVFRVHPPSLDNLTAALENLLASTDDFSGRLITVFEDGIEVVE